MSAAAPPKPIGHCGRHELPVGERIYAVGDVHGRLDLLDELIEAVLRDNGARPTAKVTILLLGDLIDRGHDSSKVVSHCMQLSQRSGGFVVLKGNHEAMMVQAYRGSRAAMRVWLRAGGDATLHSYGVPAEIIDEANLKKLIAAMRATVTRSTIDWLDRLPVTYQAGDYFFVHAGVRPGVALSRQRDADILWIKEEFTDDVSDHSMMIVHGHSECDEGPDVRKNRIGIDTAAYRSDVLTALGLERGSRWTLNTVRAKDAAPRSSFEPAVGADEARRHRMEAVLEMLLRPQPMWQRRLGRRPSPTRYASVATALLAVAVAASWMIRGSERSPVSDPPRRGSADRSGAEPVTLLAVSNTPMSTVRRRPVGGRERATSGPSGIPRARAMTDVDAQWPPDAHHASAPRGVDQGEHEALAAVSPGDEERLAGHGDSSSPNTLMAQADPIELPSSPHLSEDVAAAVPTAGRQSARAAPPAEQLRREALDLIRSLRRQ